MFRYFSSLILFGLAFFALFAPAPQAQERFFDAQLARLAREMYGMEHASSFRFIVTGDTQTPWASYEAVKAGEMDPYQSEAFRQILAEANRLDPAFVMIVGDLILGYGTPEMLQKEWEVFSQTAAASRPPLLAVPGNHDATDRAAAAIWRQRMGELYYSFDAGNCHFIGLYSEEAEVAGEGDTGVIAGQQLAWLQADLRKHWYADHIFIFLHKPFFKTEEYPQGNWEEVHALLKEYPVRAVFAGHWHEYRKCDARDGIEYVITGGGGNAELQESPELGEFNHFLLVNVAGDEVNWAVVRPGSILPADVVTDALHREKKALEACISFSPAIAPFADARLPAELTVTVTNPTDRDLETELVWDLPSPNWKITPQTAAWTIPARGTESLAFTLGAEQVNDSAWMSGPLPSISAEMPFQQGKSRLTVRRYLGADKPSIECLRALRTPAIDGNLSDWEMARPVWIGYPEAPDTWTPDDIAAALRLLWDDRFLYIGAEVWDDVFAPAADEAGLFSGDSVSVVIAGFDCALAQIGEAGAAFKVPETEPYTPVKDARVQITRVGQCTIYEAAIPLRAIFDKRPGAGDVISASNAAAYWHDRDEDDAVASTWWPCEIVLK